MPFWTYFFEVSIVIFYLISVIFLLKKKEYRKLSTLIAGALLGVLLEFLHVYIGGAYGYSREFILQVGNYPANIPLAIGLAWGMLLLSSHEISDCYDFPIIIRTLFESFFVVSIDLFLDVVAIRLDGGFWTWKNEVLNLSITSRAFFGVIWGNFYGWFFVIFFMSLILHLFYKRQDSDKIGPLTKRTFLSVVIAETCIFGSLLLTITLGELVWLVFLMQYFGSIIVVVVYSIRNKISRSHQLETLFPLAFYFYFYGFCIATMIYLGLAIEIPFFFILNIAYAATVLIYLFRLSKLK
ncbi:MAG: carotenoid biosynthesis protein [Promethearchaeota archaeon]